MPLHAPQELRTYFVTTVTAKRRRLFQLESNSNLLLTTLADYRNQNRYELHAFVIMPDHLHAILTPSPKVSLEKAMQFIKGGFSFRVKSKLDVWTEASMNPKYLLCRSSNQAKSILNKTLSGRGLSHLQTLQLELRDEDQHARFTSIAFEIRGANARG